MKIEFEINNFENTGDITPEKLQRFAEIFKVLVEKGALTGIKGGSANIHFDRFGDFVGLEMVYWPWRKRDLN